MFAKYAPLYWAKEMPAIPLRPKQKVPWLYAWSHYCSQMPTLEEQSRWAASYPDGNIGLPLGPQSRVIGLDLDSEDPRVLAILEKLMPVTPWKRVGRKGAVYGFRYNGERTYRIKDEENRTILELLSRGAQIVLPPSIHPDTQRPYEASGNLFELVDELPGLPADFEEKIRSALIDAGFKLTSRGTTRVAEWVPAGGRDSQMVAQAGILARAVIRGERTVLEACNEIVGWLATYTEKVAGDEMDPLKARQKVMEFVRRDVTENGKNLPPNWQSGMSAKEIADARAYFGQDVEEWTQDQIMVHLAERFSEIPREDMTARIPVIDAVLLKMAKSESLGELDKDIVLSYILTANNKQITMAAMRKRLRELSGQELVGNDHTEIAEAMLKEMEREGEVRFDVNNFYRWYGSHWRRVGPEEVGALLARQFGHLSAARRFSDHKGIVQVMQRLAAKPLKLHEAPGINFANGFLTNDMELLAHDPAFGSTYCLPYRYIPDDQAPSMWMSFLDQCWGAEPDFLERVQALREAIASTLFGVAYKYQRVFCLYGVAGSGKSTMLDVVLGLIPSDASCSVPPQDWTERFKPATMSKKLVNFAGELSESRMIDGALFKGIVEGAEMSGEYKGQDIFKFSPQCAHWFCSNHLPRSRDTSAGFTRRWLFWSFKRPIDKTDIRRGLAAEILGTEREAIVAWAAPAIKALLRREDYVETADHLRLVGEVANQNNSVRHFLTSGGLEFGPECVVTERELYASYYSYCRVLANAPAVAAKSFRAKMADLQREFKLVLCERPGSGETYFSGVSIPKRTARVA